MENMIVKVLIIYFALYFNAISGFALSPFSENDIYSSNAVKETQEIWSGPNICTNPALCHWRNANWNEGRRLLWLRTNPAFVQSVLRMFANSNYYGTAPNDNESLPEIVGEYAISGTDSPDKSQDDKASAVLQSDVIPCQIGDARLIFQYWTSPFVILKVCLKRWNRERGGTPAEDFYFCKQVNTDQGPGPANIRLPASDDLAFQIYIISFNFLYEPGGYAIINNVHYVATICQSEQKSLDYPYAYTDTPELVDIPYDEKFFSTFARLSLPPFPSHNIENASSSSADVRKVQPSKFAATNQAFGTKQSPAETAEEQRNEHSGLQESTEIVQIVFNEGANSRNGSENRINSQGPQTTVSMAISKNEDFEMAQAQRNSLTNGDKINKVFEANTKNNTSSDARNFKLFRNEPSLFTGYSTDQPKPSGDSNSNKSLLQKELLTMQSDSSRQNKMNIVGNGFENHLNKEITQMAENVEVVATRLPPCDPNLKRVTVTADLKIVADDPNEANIEMTDKPLPDRLFFHENEPELDANRRNNLEPSGIKATINVGMRPDKSNKATVNMLQNIESAKSEPSNEQTSQNISPAQSEGVPPAIAASDNVVKALAKNADDIAAVDIVTATVATVDSDTAAVDNDIATTDNDTAAVDNDKDVDAHVHANAINTSTVNRTQNNDNKSDTNKNERDAKGSFQTTKNETTLLPEHRGVDLAASFTFNGTQSIPFVENVPNRINIVNKKSENGQKTGANTTEETKNFDNSQFEDNINSTLGELGVVQMIPSIPLMRDDKNSQNTKNDIPLGENLFKPEIAKNDNSTDNSADNKNWQNITNTLPTLTTTVVSDHFSVPKLQKFSAAEIVKSQLSTNSNHNAPTFEKNPQKNQTNQSLTNGFIPIVAPLTAEGENAVKLEIENSFTQTTAMPPKIVDGVESSANSNSDEPSRNAIMMNKIGENVENSERLASSTATTFVNNMIVSSYSMPSVGGKNESSIFQLNSGLQGGVNVLSMPTTKASMTREAKAHGNSVNTVENIKNSLKYFINSSPVMQTAFIESSNGSSFVVELVTTLPTVADKLTTVITVISDQQHLKNSQNGVKREKEWNMIRNYVAPFASKDIDNWPTADTVKDEVKHNLTSKPSKDELSAVKKTLTSNTATIATESPMENELKINKDDNLRQLSSGLNGNFIGTTVNTPIYVFPTLKTAYAMPPQSRIKETEMKNTNDLPMTTNRLTETSAKLLTFSPLAKEDAADAAAAVKSAKDDNNSVVPQTAVHALNLPEANNVDSLKSGNIGEILSVKSYNLAVTPATAALNAAVSALSSAPAAESEERKNENLEKSVGSAIAAAAISTATTTTTSIATATDKAEADPLNGDYLPKDISSKLSQLFAQKCVDPAVLNLPPGSRAKLAVINSMYIYADQHSSLPKPREIIGNIAAHFHNEAERIGDVQATVTPGGDSNRNE